MSANRKTLSLAKRSSRKTIHRAERALARWLPVKPCWISPKKTIVSFTFDDVPDNAVSNGASLLNQHGCSGTFYLCGDLCEADFEPWHGYARADVQTLIDNGHEIGCHTYTHPDVQTLSREDVRDQVAQNRRWLNEAAGPVPLSSFAYPYGSTGIRQKLELSKHFQSCRGVVEGLNRGLTDFAQLRAYRLYDHLFPDGKLEPLLQRASSEKAWLIFYTHDVQENPSPHGCTPEFLSRAVELAKSMNCEILTVREAIRSLI